MILGQPKTFAEVPDFNDAALARLYTLAEQILQSGQPLEIPMALPVGQLVTFAVMLQRCDKRIAELEAQLASDAEPSDAGDDTPSEPPAPVVGDRPEGFNLDNVLPPPADEIEKEA